METRHCDTRRDARTLPDVRRGSRSRSDRWSRLRRLRPEGGGVRFALQPVLGPSSQPRVAVQERSARSRVPNALERVLRRPEEFSTADALTTSHGISRRPRTGARISSRIRRTSHTGSTMRQWRRAGGGVRWICGAEILGDDLTPLDEPQPSYSNRAAESSERSGKRVID